MSEQTLKDFYEFEQKQDKSWCADREAQIKYGKIDFLYKHAHHLSGEELVEVEQYFIENNDGFLLDMFNKGVRWELRKKLGNKVNGLFSTTEYYKLDWLSKPFNIAEQCETELKLHLKKIEEKIKNLNRSIDGEKLRKKAYVSFHMPTGAMYQLDKEREEDEKEIAALKSAHENILYHLITLSRNPNGL